MGDADRLQTVRPLGGDRACVVARDASRSPARLVVVERVAGHAARGEARVELLRRVKALAALEHPKVLRVREVVEAEAEVLVVSDFVDGEWLSALLALEPRPPLEAVLRLVLDVLEGLSALHGLHDDRGRPLRYVHGMIAPETVLVGDDGVAEIARASGATRVRVNERCVAPELRGGGESTDARSDLYSVGAMLREALAAAESDATWAEGLAEVASRACAASPGSRWPTAAAMATAVRKIAGARLPAPQAVAEIVRDRFGERIKARREMLEIADEEPPASGIPLSLRSAEIISVEQPSATLVTAKATASKAPPPLPAPAPTRDGEDEGPEPATLFMAKPEPTAAEPPREEKSPPPAAAKPIRSLPPKASLPPPDIQPGDGVSDGMSDGNDAYRRRMPTFVTSPPEAPPARPRRSLAVPAMGVAAAMVVSFGLGWWVARNHPPPQEAAPALTATENLTPAATATPAATPTATPTASSPLALPAAPASRPQPIAAAARPKPAVAAAPPAATTAADPDGLSEVPATTNPEAPPKAAEPAAPKAEAKTAEPSKAPEPKPEASSAPAPSAGYVPAEL